VLGLSQYVGVYIYLEMTSRIYEARSKRVGTYQRTEVWGKMD